MLPHQFLYDLCRHWFQCNVPSGRAAGKNTFLSFIRLLAAKFGWQETDVRLRTPGKMDYPEPLILEYDVTEWKGTMYRGNSPDMERRVNRVQGVSDRVKSREDSGK